MSDWPSEKAPPLSIRGVRKKNFSSATQRDAELHEALREDAHTTGTLLRNQSPDQRVRKAVQAIASLRARDAVDPLIWEALYRTLSRLEGKHLLCSAAMGCRVVKMMIDMKRKQFVVKQHEVEGEVNVNGAMVIKDFSMSDDPLLNRARARVGMFCWFWKKENLKEWGDLRNDNFESTPAGPVFYGCYPGCISAIGDNSIYIFAFESLQQKGYEALDTEDKRCYHLVLPEGADYKQKVGDSRPVFIRGWSDYQGRMLKTAFEYRVRFEESIEIIPHARLTEESQIFVLDQVSNHLKPGKVKDLQTLISESDQAWYREAGCPEPGMAYVKGEDGSLEVTGHISVPQPYRSGSEDRPDLMICMSDDDLAE